jgi:hypothetical protein
MAGKPGPASDGLHQQIDELDALLDRLLKIPLGPAPPPVVKSNPSLKLVGAGDSMLEVMDEAMELDEPVLRFRPNTDSIDEPTSSAEERAPLHSDFGTFPVLRDDPDGSESPTDVLPLNVEQPTQTVNRLGPLQIPWVEDEPAPTPAATDSIADAPAPIPTLRGIQAAGPRIEIVQGSLSTSVMLPDGTFEEEQHVQSVGIVRRLCWITTWLFDVTVGLLFPGLKRLRGKRVVALAGVALLGASAYLSWKWWW